MTSRPNDVQPSGHWMDEECKDRPEKRMKLIGKRVSMSYKKYGLQGNNPKKIIAIMFAYGMYFGGTN